MVVNFLQRYSLISTLFLRLKYFLAQYSLNEQSSVYSATLTAGEGAAAVINTAGWSPGSYTITIVRSNGKTCAGEFEL
jgi:hypothetical protein